MSNCNKPVKEQNKSGVTNKEYVKQLGGYPEKKTVEQIDKANRPTSRSKPPGAFRP